MPRQEQEASHLHLHLHHGPLDNPLEPFRVVHSVSLRRKGCGRQNVLIPAHFHDPTLPEGGQLVQ